jgi:hypothetical protein
LLSRLFLHPRRSIREPDACDFTVTHAAVTPRRTRAAAVSLASRFLAERPIQCDDPNPLATDQ